jgi:hypothetical protein
MYENPAKLRRNLRTIEQMPDGNDQLENMLVAWQEQYGELPDARAVEACAQYVVNVNSSSRMVIGTLAFTGLMLSAFMNACSAFMGAG